MARATYHELTLDVPDGWEDASIISLLAPAPPQASMLTTKRVDAERPNLILKRQRVPGGELDLEAFAAEQERVMAQLVADVKIVARGTMTIGTTTAVTRELTFTAPPRALRQLQAYFLCGETLFTAVGTAAFDPTFETMRRDFRRILEGATLVAGDGVTPSRA